MDKSEEMKEYTDQVLHILHDEQEELNQLQVNIEDVNDSWNEAKQSINKAVYRKAIESGITQEIY